MRLVRYFEYMNYNNSKLTEDEFYDEVGDALELIDFDNFTDREVEKVKVFVNKINPAWTCGLVRRDISKFPPLGIMFNCSWVKQTSGYVHHIMNYPAVDIEVMKTEDQWFYIRKLDFEVVVTGGRSGSPRRTTRHKETFYKCDQIEGLLETLEKLIK